MKKLFATAIAFALALCAPTIPAGAQNIGPIYCNQSSSAFPASATTTLVQAAAGTGSARILICGWHLQSTGGTGQLVYGTQVTNPCDTGQIKISPLYASGALGDDQSSNWRGLTVPNGNQVCIVTGASTTAAQVFIYWTFG